MFYNEDCLDFLERVEDAQLVVTSPPYNLNKEYENRTDLQDYIKWQSEVIAKCAAKLNDQGSICWQVGHYIYGSGRHKEAYPLDLVLYPVFKDLGLKLRNRIIWTFGHGLHDKVRFSGRHETILWFTKTDDYIFNLDPVRIPQKYPNKRYFKGPNKGKLSGNPKGKNPGDVWNIPNVKNNHVEKTFHPCQYPVGLIERLVLSLTNEGDLVVDPFMGVGSTGVACALHNRKFMGSDTELKYVEEAKKRYFAAKNGNLKIRPMNKPVN